MASKKPPTPPVPPTPKRKEDGATQLKERTTTKRPRLYRVVMHNDDYTTQEFVIFVLQQFFRKDTTEAAQLMLKVHMSGRAIVGVFTKDLAETKVALVSDYARDNGHPLQLTSEPDA